MTDTPVAALEMLAGDRSVAAAVDRARRSVDQLLSHRLLRRRSGEVSAECMLRGAVANAQLADPDAASLERVREALVTAPEDPVPPASRRVLPPVTTGALRLYAGLGPLQATWERAPRQTLARMHVLLMNGLLPAAELGVVRPGAAVPPRDLTARLSALSELVVAPRQPPSIVLAAVVHGELAATSPFGGPPGVSALIGRAAERLVLICRGLDPKALTVPEVGHRDRGADYPMLLAGYASGDADGVCSWLVHCADAVADGAREGLAVCQALQRAG